MQEILVRSLGGEDPLEKEMATHSSFFFFFILNFLCWDVADQCCEGFRWMVKGLSQTQTCIHSPPNSPPIQAAT